MPCYDKKLEASRSDFYNAQYATRDVDCVLTTGELLLLAQEHGVDLALPVPDEVTPLSPSSASASPALPDLLNPPGSSSGSYLYSLMLAVARTHPHPLTLESKTVRSADYVEYTLRDSSSGSPVFRGATCYGFRNLQNVVRRVGRAAGVQVGRGAAGRLAGGLRSGGAANAGAAYDYVEVMACPGGCVGGGGQLRAPERKTASSSSNSMNDAEGFARDWTVDGVRPGGVGNAGSGTDNFTSKAGPTTSEAPWSSRAWTREVELAYWGGGPAPALSLGNVLLALPTPPASPKPRGSLGDGGAGGKSAERESRGAEGNAVSPSPSQQQQQQQPRLLLGDSDSSVDQGAETIRVELEALVERALGELCAPVVGPQTPGPGSGPDLWDGRSMTTTDEAAEARRRGFFRTQYRAVESEVVGLGVKW